MAVVPISGTNIRLLTGIPFQNDYKHTRWFDTLSEQTTYFTNKTVVHSISDYTVINIQNGRHFIRVDKSIDELRNVNYCMFQNTDYSSKWWYAFVTKLEYVQHTITDVVLELDVFQTWKFDMNFQPSYVVREHCPLWNADGTPVLNTLDEGLNYGQNYETVSTQNVMPYPNILFLVIVAKERMDVNGTGITPMVNGSPQPLSYYLLPFKQDGTMPVVTVDGFDINISPPTEVLKKLYTLTNTVNNIVSLFVTEFPGVLASYSDASNTLALFSDTVSHVTIQDSTQTFNVLYVENLPEYATSSLNCGDKYEGFETVEESKLMMYPYCVTVLDDFKGNRIELKNEYINDTNLWVNVKGSMGTSNKTAYSPNNYLQDDTQPFSGQTKLENALINNAPNDVPIITDLLSAFLQGNKNSLENQRNSIFFNGQMSVLGSTVGGVNSALHLNTAGVASSVVDIAKSTGNTVLKLQAINAKQRDIDNVPSQLTKMGGNTAFNYGNELTGVFIIKKQITPEYRKKLSDYFNLYGYKVHEVKMPNFHTRQNWNYVQTESCTILGNFNNEDLNDLKRIFDNGITFWHTDDIGNYDLENGVI